MGQPVGVKLVLTYRVRQSKVIALCREYAIYARVREVGGPLYRGRYHGNEYEDYSLCHQYTEYEKPVHVHEVDGDQIEEDEGGKGEEGGEVVQAFDVRW